MNTILLAAAFLAQDDPHKGMAYRSNLDKALEYCAGQTQGGNVVPPFFAGLAFLLDGRDAYKDDVERIVQSAMQEYKREDANLRNWYVAYGALFLSIVYSRDPRPEIRAALEDIMKTAERTAEETGGWCHHKGHWQKFNYLKTGGAKDLSMVTATMVSAMLIMKRHGMKIPDGLLDRALANLRALGGGGGLAYGTANRHPDVCLSRLASVYIGTHVAGRTDLPFMEFRNCKAEAFRAAESGHGYGPVHFFALAVASKLAGRYPEMANYWLPLLAQRQKPDGTLVLFNDGGKVDGEKDLTAGHRIGSTGVFALMILLQRYDLVPKSSKPKESPFKKR